LGQYRQIDIGIILGKIGFECISTHAQGFLKALGRKPSGEGSRLTGQLALLRYHYSHPVFCISVYECLSAVVFVVH
jgi:hypothetical protein